MFDIVVQQIWIGLRTQRYRLASSLHKKVEHPQICCMTKWFLWKLDNLSHLYQALENGLMFLCIFKPLSLKVAKVQKIDKLQFSFTFPFNKISWYEIFPQEIGFLLSKFRISYTTSKSLASLALLCKARQIYRLAIQALSYFLGCLQENYI